MEKIKVDERKQQKKHLSSRWQCMKYEELLEDKFYIISFQSYFEFPDEEGYQPCELAVVEYSLKHGVSKEFHAMIDPGPIKRGLGAEAKIYSDNFHKIPTYGFELARKDHFNLWEDLEHFVNPGRNREIPPLFSKVGEHRKNVACLEYLAGLVGRHNRLSKVFLWEHLVLALYENAGVTAPSMNIIEDGGNSSMYDFERGTKCDYHDELECIHCSLLTVKKCCFWISDAFSNIYKYDITENHLPVRQAPQYSVISAEDIILNSTTKRRFLGADVMPPYDPNLPAGLQRGSLRDLLASESSMDEDAAPFESRDIRYRKISHKLSGIGAGRGMVLATARSAVSRSRDETLSVAETIDDVASAILEDYDIDSSVMADDEGSVDLRSRASSRPPSVNSVIMQHNLPGPSGVSLSGKLEQIRLNDNAGSKWNPNPLDSLNQGNDEYRSDSSTADDDTQRESPCHGKIFAQRSTIDRTLASGDASRFSSGVESQAENDKGKHFARSKVALLGLLRNPALSNTPLCFGRGRLLQKNTALDANSTYQSDSE